VFQIELAFAPAARRGSSAHREARLAFVNRSHSSRKIPSLCPFAANLRDGINVPQDLRAIMPQLRAGPHALSIE
jgi:hypothetical protein